MVFVMIPHVLGNDRSDIPITFAHVNVGFAISVPAMKKVAADKRSGESRPHYVSYSAYDFESFQALHEP